MRKPSRTTEAPEPGPKYSAPAVEKTLDILEYLSGEPSPKTRTEIARALGRGPSELFRMLTCLEERGYVRRDPVSGTYGLTLRLFELGHMHTPYDTLMRVSAPVMQALVADTGESCHLSVLHGNHLVVLLQEETRKPFRLSVEVGGRHPPHRTTSGRIILAQLGNEERDAVLQAQPDYMQRKAPEKKGFLDQLRLLRESGYHLTEGEWLRGEIVLGVPIGSPASKVKAALVIPTLALIDQQPVLDMLPMLKRRAAEITRSAGLAELPSGGRGSPRGVPS
jgi:DNA-binding IclR family transcriptional regulator